MSRNKENIPLTSSQRVNGSLRPPTRNFHGDEFFTDSLLDATRLSSRIPTPSPQKAALVKPRRARNTKLTRNAQHPSHRSSTSDHVISQFQGKDHRPSTPQRNGTGIPKLRTHSLSTPPGASDEPPLASPYSSISSPPPQDITDAYQQIQDDEDLAQTEREISSDESNNNDVEPVRRPNRLHHRSHSETKVRPPPLVTRSSAASTPTRNSEVMNGHGFANGQAETLSEASGLSFLKDMTDQGLADALTPHMSERAKDRARLKEVWDQKPLKAFSKARNPRREILAEDSSLQQQQKRPAFGKATAPVTNGLQSWNEIPNLQGGFGVQQYDDDASVRSNDSPLPARYQAPTLLPLNQNVERHFPFTRNHGFPRDRLALTEKNLEQQNRGSPAPTQPLRSHSSTPNLASDRPTNNAHVGDAGRLRAGQTSRLPLFQRSLRTATNPIPEEPSQIDWAAAAAEIPVPSVESSSASEEKIATPTSLSRFSSPGKSRRGENDFTGHSFQVSESPPVRQKQPIIEQGRDKEIQVIAKQAVTTSRLSEIRERSSQESLRNTSKSPGSRSAPRSIESKVRPPIIDENESEIVGIPVPDTPVVIYRTSSNNSSDRASKSSERPEADKGQSHDRLQRLARAMSSTPRSSPAPDSGLQNQEQDALKAATRQVEEASPSKAVESDKVPVQKSQDIPPGVAETPRVSGAWTDTILPDTVKTTKQANKNIPIAQTPHVSAGGWIDTPAPVNAPKYSSNISTIVEEVSEEVPEELIAGIVKNTASNDTLRANGLNSSVTPQTQSHPQSSETVPEVDQPKSALASILEQQKKRLESQDVSKANAEDTLNLGNETLESFEGLLGAVDDTVDEMENTITSFNDMGTDTETFKLLCNQIQQVRSDVKRARNGISKLEHQVLEPMMPLTAVPVQPLLSDTECTSCNQQAIHPHAHIESHYMPYASLHLSIPIPLLFHPRKLSQRIPRPTILGTIVLAIWTWYLIETIMCELYCRPEYTDFYIWPSQPEPEFPLVLPTMLARWTRLNNLGLDSHIKGLYQFVLRIFTAFWRIFNMAFGFSDGFVADAPSAPTRIVQQIIETATSIAAAATDVDLSMNDDEFL